MKRCLVVEVLKWSALALFSVGIAIAQQAQIVHYDAPEKASSKRPDFKGAVIAIDFGGTAAINAQAYFMKLGARDFVKGNNPCVVDRTIICVRTSVGSPMQLSSYGSTSSYGRNGGISTSSSFSGSLYPIEVTVFLVVYNKNDGGNRPTILLGKASCVAAAGSGSEWVSSGGRGSSGSFSSGSSSGLDSSASTAINWDLTRLLSGNLFAKFWAAGAYAKWLPGADVTVKNAFAQ